MCIVVYVFMFCKRQRLGLEPTVFGNFAFHEQSRRDIHIADDAAFTGWTHWVFTVRPPYASPTGYLTRIGVSRQVPLGGDSVPAHRATKPTTSTAVKRRPGERLHLVGNDGHDALAAPPDAVAGTLRTGIPRGVPHLLRRPGTLEPLRPAAQYLRRKGLNRLVYMADLIADCGSGGFYLDDYEALLEAMARDENRKSCWA